jgi:hypothetical protein
MLTRKDFKKMAAEIAKIENRTTAQELAEFCIKTCKESNPRFDAQRFLAACGL